MEKKAFLIIKTPKEGCYSAAVQSQPLIVCFPFAMSLSKAKPFAWFPEQF
jgi:hypothetical protein